MNVKLTTLYPDADRQRARYGALRDRLLELRHAPEEIRYFSAPGRTELGGNHTDHQNGHVLAASVNIDMAAACAENGDGVIRVFSDSYAPIYVELSDLTPQPGEKARSAALIRGIAANIVSRGYTVGGFDLMMTSDVPPGSGLSSSAAFEVLLGTVMNELFCGGSLTAVEIAQIGQWAENVYFDKPCGLMDQLACACGGVIGVDLSDPKQPVIRQLQVSLERAGYALAIIRCGDDHADLTDDYGAIPVELGHIAAVYDKTSVLALDRAAVLRDLPQLHKRVGDRAILRMLHIWDDDQRAAQQAEALAVGDWDSYLRLVRESGESSWMYLQNVLSSKDPAHQSLAFTLALCRQLLEGRGACRVHGGGFAGTAQAYVPLDMADSFRRSVDRVLGAGACMLLSIRAYGGTELTFDCM